MIYTYEMLVNDLAEKFHLSSNDKCQDYIKLYMENNQASRNALTMTILDTLSHYCCGKYQITLGEFNEATEGLTVLLRRNIKDSSFDEHLQEAMKVYLTDGGHTSTKSVH